MSKRKKANDWFEEHVTLNRLLVVISMLVIVALMMATWSIWSFFYSKIISVLKPFIYGFIIAYLMYPVAKFFEKKGIKRGITIPILWIIIIVLVSWSISSIIPKLLRDSNQLLIMMNDGIKKLIALYQANAHNAPSDLMAEIIKQITVAMNSIMGIFSDIPLHLSNVFGQTISLLTTWLFSITISIYFVMDYEKITAHFIKYAHMISPKIALSLKVVDQSVSSYLRTLFVIMLISFVEYSVLYFLVGHHYAFMMGILSALGLLIPYVGGILVNILGFLTALNLPGSKIFILGIALLILPNIDGYVISPLVYSRRNKVEPLWSLFAFFASSMLFGVLGIFISMPLYFSIRSILQLRRNNWVLDAEN